MAGKKRIMILEENLDEILHLKEVKTQELRVKLIAELEKLFYQAMGIAESPTTENREDWAKICAYIAQVINTLANSYDETRFNEQMKQLEEMIAEAKRKLGKAPAGTPIA